MPNRPLDLETRLTPFQTAFCREYVMDDGPEPGKSTRAAIKAGYGPTAAKKAGYELMRKAKVFNYIEKLRLASSRRVGITQDRIMQELALIGFANLKNIVTVDEEGNTTVDWHMLSHDNAAALLGIDIETVNGKTKIKKIRVKMADKLNALVTMGKQLGMFKEQVEVKGTLSLAQLIEQSMEKPQIEDKSNDLPIIEGETVEVEEIASSS